MILVAGGTGRLGSLVVRELTEHGLPVRVLSRNPAVQSMPGSGSSQKSSRIGTGQTDVVAADVGDVEAVRTAMEGVDVVVSAVHGFLGRGAVSPRTVDRDGNLNLIAAAGDAGAAVVLMSIVGAAERSPVELFAMKWAAEERLRRSGVPWTIVRSDAFTQTWFDVLEETAGRSHRPVIFGHGHQERPWVSVDDVAALVVRAVLDPELRGRTLEICGPEAMSLTALAEHLMARRGWSGQPRHIHPFVLRCMAATVGRVRPDIGRQVRTALFMDAPDPFAGNPLPAGGFADLRSTPVSAVPLGEDG